MKALDPAAGERALAGAAGLAPVCARRFAAEGLVHALDGAPFVAAETRDPVLASADLYVPWLAPELQAGVEPLRRWQRAVARTWPHVDRVVVRVPAGSWPDGGGVPLSSYLRCTARPGGQAPPAALEIAAAGPHEYDFVWGLLGRALVTGYGDGAVDEATATAVARSEFPLAEPGTTVRALVARWDGVPQGHITWDEASRDDVSGETLLEVVDLLVLDGPHRRDCVDALLQGLHRAGAARGLDLLGEVTRTGADAGARARAGLLGAGWVPYYDLWLLRADAGGG